MSENRSTSYSDWHKCYAIGWGTLLVPEAFAHPAKVSLKLAERIYDHLIDEGLLKPGDHVLDPFGGIAGFALHAMRHGLKWTGIELEEKFCKLGGRNITKWNTQFGALPGWGSARLLQGDSRRLAYILDTNPTAIISSPPFLHTEGGCKASGGTIDNALMARHSASNRNTSGYGETPGQLHNLPEGDLDGVISSPPYADGCAHNGGDDPNHEYIAGGEYHGVGLDGVISSPPYSGARIGQESGQEHCGHHDQYGATDGQLGAMNAGDLDGVISSPPYSASDQNYKNGWERFHRTRQPLHQNDIQREAQYGNTTGQLGGEEGESFWAATRLIVEQCFQLLKPGGVAVWVVKSFVKNKEVIDFPGQWQRLCEAIGFETIHYHRAWLVESRGAQYDLMGNLVEKRVERKSFFRRLAEKKGSPRIDYEVVLCMRKPTP
jgi:hypothetical protein